MTEYSTIRRGPCLESRCRQWGESAFLTSFLAPHQTISAHQRCTFIFQPLPIVSLDAFNRHLQNACELRCPVSCSHLDPLARNGGRPSSAHVAFSTLSGLLANGNWNRGHWELLHCSRHDLWALSDDRGNVQARERSPSVASRHHFYSDDDAQCIMTRLGNGLIGPSHCGAGKLNC